MKATSDPTLGAPDQLAAGMSGTQARLRSTLAELFRGRTLRALFARLAAMLVTLVVITYLTFLGLTMAGYSEAGRAEQTWTVAGESLRATVGHVINHPATYTWRQEEVASLGFVLETLGRSTGLLLISLGLATAIGVPLGIVLALARRRRVAPLVVLLSVLGISTPSFLLAMLFWVIDIQAHRRLGLPALPPTGFGWDAHVVMPALVLAARPLAQIVQIVYVSLSDILGQDYIRTAEAKGLPRRAVLARHAIPNVTIPTLTTLGMSLRLSLASLPVVEFFFLWPGVGMTLLQALELRMVSLVADLILALGLLFLLVNLALELVYPILDPRLRDAGQGWMRQERRTWREWLEEVSAILAGWWEGLRGWIPGRRGAGTHLPPLLEKKSIRSEAPEPASTKSTSRGRTLRSIFRNPPLLVGTLLVVLLFGLALFGDRLTDANPYETHGTMTIDGEIGGPPFPPSSVFPWGTDAVGRDLQALVLAGTKRTLALALFAMIARVVVGTFLGTLAGWWQGSRFDKLVTGGISVWAAFPVTLFAMILILALGIREGMGVFIVALCIVGWGEIAQFVRGQVIAIKPKLHIEAARSIGTRADQILTQHVLPSLVPSLLVLAVLEMGGVLMLLAELGFLDIFLGGGFRAQIGETGRMSPVVYHFSDVPEWGALLANIRDWWRSYPWLAWYPGLAFFLAILAFNLWGEGLRRFLNEAPVNVGRLFNRYSLLGAGVVIFSLTWVLQSNAPLGVYRDQARQFEAERALQDIQALASPEFEGRESGTSGAKRAAEYIAGRMEEIGLFAAGDNDSFIQTYACPRSHLVEEPLLEILDEQGNVSEALGYRRDFVEYVGMSPTYGEAQGAIVGLITGPVPEIAEGDPFHFRSIDLRGKVLVVREENAFRATSSTDAEAVLVITDDPEKLRRKELFPSTHNTALRRGPRSLPVLFVTPETADRLLVTTGSSLAELDSVAAELEPGGVGMTGDGVTVRVAVTVPEADFDEECYNVIGYIPGVDSMQRLDSQVIMVSAYYDGLGTGPDGTLYPGANDNASGVGTMLEMARVLKNGPYQPKKTLVFVARSEGERGEGLSVLNVMSAKIGFNQLTVEAVIELSGVGAGDGDAIALDHESSFRLTQLFQEAGKRMGSPTTLQGRDPHFDAFTRAGFGRQTAMTARVSWDGSDRIAHTQDDVVEAIDPEKLRRVGQTTLLAITTASREINY